MQVLLIAPEIGHGSITDEVRAISDSLRPHIINGHVTRQAVVEAIRRQNWDIIWFASHGTETGIQLSDAELPTADLTSLVRSSQCHLLVLNSCRSESAGLRIHYETKVDVITTITDVPDPTAYQTGALFAMNLAKGMGIEEAYNLSRPGQSKTYMLFTSNQYQDTEAKFRERHHEPDEQTTTIRMIYALFSRLEKQMQSLRNELIKEIEAIIAEINTIRADIKPLEREIYSKPQTQRSEVPVNIAIAAATIAVIVLWWSIVGAGR